MVRKILLFSVIPLLLVGCASGPGKEITGSTTESPPTRVGLLTIMEPELYKAGVQTYDVPQFGFTLPGRIAGMGIAASVKGMDTASHNYAFTKAVRDSGFRISATLTSEITRDLAAVGYEVIPVRVADHRHAGEIRGRKYLGQYPPTAPPVDFYLHLEVEQAGYTAPDHGQPLVPYLRVFTQLVSLAGQAHPTPTAGVIHEVKEEQGEASVLYAATITYGGFIPIAGPNDIPADPRYGLRGMEHIEHPEHVARGLAAAARDVAEKLAENLK
ncbi:MAG: hypothetical protein SVU69_13175 [Pseudomonadota bacterium]|nr:hypothetical protein [Pseudomonadota bacterium]